jgi:tRNA1Val (adenine37-N6)-methyltransferase
LPNNYFQFKQFGIDQTNSTLRVCTDSCLFGAWVAREAANFSTALDIGTGTGLLALMLAQKHPNASVSAIEIDKPCADLALRNFEVSPWKSSLRLTCSDVRQFSDQGMRFGLILSNPPFFENQLKSSNQTNNLAKHSSQLSQEQLLDAVLKMLSEKGVFYALLPEKEAQELSALAAKHGLFLWKECVVRNTESGLAFRHMQAYCLYQTATEHSEMVIYEAEKQYTAAFVALLKDYYLYL